MSLVQMVDQDVERRCVVHLIYDFCGLTFRNADGLHKQAAVMHHAEYFARKLHTNAPLSAHRV
jgi:hypothetical protein